MKELSSIHLILFMAAAVVGWVFLRLMLRASRDRIETNVRLTQLVEQQQSLRDTFDTRLRDQERGIVHQLKHGAEKTTDSLQQIRERLAVMDQAQQKITTLSEQMVGLENILANKQTRGAFGEIQLRDLVETLMPPDAYTFQMTLSNGKRADCLLRLPNPPGPMVIDSKFPLESWQRLQAAADQSQREAAGRQFRNDVLTHVRDIRNKYILPGETGDAALMFLPSESVYAELHTHHTPVIEQSFRSKVYIVSPTTLWATLNTVRAVFRDVRMREQAHRIQQEVETLVGDIARLDDRVSQLARHFNQATADIDRIQTSSKKIVQRGEKIVGLDWEVKEPDSLPPDPSHR